MQCNNLQLLPNYTTTIDTSEHQQVKFFQTQNFIPINHMTVKRISKN